MKTFDTMTDRELSRFIDKRAADNDGGILGGEHDPEYANACLERENRLRYFLAAKYGDKA